MLEKLFFPYRSSGLAFRSNLLVRKGENCYFSASGPHLFDLKSFWVPGVVFQAMP